MTDSQFERRITMIQQGDKQGLKEIYDEYSKVIYSVVMQVLKHPQNSEDITSDFFMKLWKIADTYCFGGKHKRWLVTIARNMALDHLRKSSRETLFSPGEDDSPEIPDTVSTEDTVIGNSAVAEALKTLDDSEKEILNMKLFADMTFRDIAGILHKPLGTVTWKYRNAVSKLKNTVQAEEVRI